MVLDGGDWGDCGERGNDRACGDVGVLSTSIESMGGSIFPVGGRGGSVFMDAGVELVGHSLGPLQMAAAKKRPHF